MNNAGKATKLACLAPNLYYRSEPDIRLLSVDPFRDRNPVPLDLEIQRFGSDTEDMRCPCAIPILGSKNLLNVAGLDIFKRRRFGDIR